LGAGTLICVIWGAYPPNSHVVARRWL